MSAIFSLYFFISVTIIPDQSSTRNVGPPVSWYGLPRNFFYQSDISQSEDQCLRTHGRIQCRRTGACQGSYRCCIACHYLLFWCYRLEKSFFGLVNLKRLLRKYFSISSSSSSVAFAVKTFADHDKLVLSSGKCDVKAVGIHGVIVAFLSRVLATIHSETMHWFSRACIASIVESSQSRMHHRRSRTFGDESK